MKLKAVLMAVLLAGGVGFGCDDKKEKKADETDEATEEIKAEKTQEDDRKDDPGDEDQEEDFTVTSDAWETGGEIPKKYTCDGQKVSPPLSWANVPEGTSSFAIIASDPDAPEGTFMHWGVYGIPVDETVLQEGVGSDEELDSGAKQAQNDFGDIGYGAICPPEGEKHTYSFTVLALDTYPSFTDTPKVEDVRESILTNVVARDTLKGTYQR
jgi:hypothetical protein